MGNFSGNKKTLAQHAADEIYEMIMSEKTFNPGDKLPNENELSSLLGVSRTTLREGIRILIEQDVLQVKRGRGTFVTDNVFRNSSVVLDDLKKMRIGLKDLYEIRLIFEPQVTELACKRASESEIRAIIKLGEAVDAAIKEGLDHTQADQKFHAAIIKASNNNFMIRLIPLINRAISESIRLSEDRNLASDTSADHKLIMDFFERRNASGARYAMAIHINHAIYNLNLPYNENFL